MSPIRLAMRDWDYLMPLALGKVKPSGFDLSVTLQDHLVEKFVNDPRYDAAEMSFSEYTRMRAKGDVSLFGVPLFPMRAFRHRCMLVAKASKLTDVRDLAGKRVGLAGASSSGQVWTLAILRHAGVDLASVELRDVPSSDDSGLFSGELDAVFRAFMPPGFYEPSNPYRQLIPDFRQAELAYFRDVGFIPGIHILAIKAAVVRDRPDLPDALSAVIDQSARMWLDARRRYTETTPWIIDDLIRTARDLPSGWGDSGYAANARMVEAFCTEMMVQNVVQTPITPKHLFPTYVV